MSDPVPLDPDIRAMLDDLNEVRDAILSGEVTGLAVITQRADRLYSRTWRVTSEGDGYGMVGALTVLSTHIVESETVGHRRDDG